MIDCVSCQIVANRALASVVYEDKKTKVFMDIQPVNPGHVLVVPKKHATYLGDLDEETGGHLFQVGKRIAKALRKCGLSCEGVNLFLADGEAAGQEVFHVHLHVFPRFQGDGFGLKLGPNYSAKPSRAALDATAARMTAAMPTGSERP